MQMLFKCAWATWAIWTVIKKCNVYLLVVISEVELIRIDRLWSASMFVEQSDSHLDDPTGFHVFTDFLKMHSIKCLILFLKKNSHIMDFIIMLHTYLLWNKSADL